MRRDASGGITSKGGVVMRRPPDGSTGDARAQADVACWGGEVGKVLDAADFVLRHNEQGIVMRHVTGCGRMQLVVPYVAPCE